MRIFASAKTGIGSIVAVGLAIGGLALGGAAGIASATSASAPRAHTIAAAGHLDIGRRASGGGGPIDFWKVTLNGGDVVQFNVATPDQTQYEFELFPPGTNDTNVPTAAPFSSAGTNFSGKTVFDLQAPYNGTFILAVCQGPNVDNFNCGQVYSGGAINPMSHYSFSTSFATKVSATVAEAETKAGPTIAHSRVMPVGRFEAGGANSIDYWKVQLSGGDVVQFNVATPDETQYEFELLVPGTNDTNFPAATSFSSAGSNFSGKTVFDLQAPYNGTFILAVCQGPNVDNFSCTAVDNGGAINPMSPYTFTTSFAARVSAKVAANETKASPTIAHAPLIGTGRFEAGGGGPIDFWKLSLNRGDVLQFNAATPNGSTYVFALYKGKTTDTSFATAQPVSSFVSNFSGKTVLDLKAPATGRFILAVCQGPNVDGFNCSEVDTGGADDPMNPYTYTASHVGGRETRTSLRLSAATVIFGQEKALKFSVAVSALFGGRPTGKVRISDGKQTVCTVRLVSGKGSCSPASGTSIPVGKYSVTGAYSGDMLSSRSRPAGLTVKKKG